MFGEDFEVVVGLGGNLVPVGLYDFCCLDYANKAHFQK